MTATHSLAWVPSHVPAIGRGEMEKAVAQAPGQRQ